MNSAGNSICHFFVYGTLCRGQCRASLWPAEPRQIVSAWVFGELYGRKDYPAMRPGGDRIAGECWRFERSDVPEVIRVLDRIEGTNQPGTENLYDRVTLEVFPIENFDDLTRPSTARSSKLDSDFQEKNSVRAYGYHYAIDPPQHGFERIGPNGEGEIGPDGEGGLCRWTL